MQFPTETPSAINLTAEASPDNPQERTILFERKERIVSARRLSMRKTREILRLAHKVGLTNRQIARSLSVSPTTVGECLRRARVAAITWPLPEEMDDEVLEGLLYGEERKSEKPLPDMKVIHAELSRKGVTLALLWEEYAQENPQDHYSYAQFTRHYRRWAGKLELSMRQAHKAGEKLFCDFAGQKMRIVDPATGEITDAPVFVAAMGFSSFTYAEATPSEELVHWVGAHAGAISYLEGVPHILVPDNTKVAITSPCRYEPDLNPTYAEMAAHYGCCVIPARVRKPKDKDCCSHCASCYISSDACWHPRPAECNLADNSLITSLSGIS
jgi:transposase